MQVVRVDKHKEENQNQLKAQKRAITKEINDYFLKFSISYDKSIKSISEDFENKLLEKESENFPPNVLGSKILDLLGYDSNYLFSLETKLNRLSAEIEANDPNIYLTENEFQLYENIKNYIDTTLKFIDENKLPFSERILNGLRLYIEIDDTGNYTPNINFIKNVQFFSR